MVRHMKNESRGWLVHVITICFAFAAGVLVPVSAYMEWPLFLVIPPLGAVAVATAVVVMRRKISSVTVVAVAVALLLLGAALYFAA